MEKEEKGMVPNTRFKPSESLSEKRKQNAVRIPVKDGEILLDRKNPFHRMLMEEYDES